MSKEKELVQEVIDTILINTASFFGGGFIITELVKLF